jgi:hypothetical protein
VHPYVEAPIVAGIAGFITFLDLDRRFYVPPLSEKRRRLWVLWWLFVVANSAAAAGIYFALRTAASFQHQSAWVRVAGVAFGYLAVIRSKFWTLHYEGGSVSVGAEYLYERVREAVMNRINRIAMRARSVETKSYAEKHSLSQLIIDARLRIGQDELMTSDEETAATAWLLKMIKQARQDEETTKIALADFVLSGKSPRSVWVVPR